MEKTKFSVLCALSVGLIFGIVSFLFYFGDWQRLGFVFCVGLFVGLVAAPEFKPKLYKNTAFFQVLSGAMAGLFAAIAFVLSTEAAVLGFLIGGLLGWFAPYWLKHMPIP